MKAPHAPAFKWPTRILLLFLFGGSCDQPVKADANAESVDTFSVKRMGIDSNSRMPVQIPKDSTVNIPNPLDEKK